MINEANSSGKKITPIFYGQLLCYTKRTQEKIKLKTCKILKPIQEALHNSSTLTDNVVIDWSESFVYYMFGTRFVVSFVFYRKLNFEPAFVE